MSHTKDCSDGYTVFTYIQYKTIIYKRLWWWIHCIYIHSIPSLNKLQNAINKKVKVGNCKLGYNSAWLQQFKPRAICVLVYNTFFNQRWEHCHQDATCMYGSHQIMQIKIQFTVHDKYDWKGSDQTGRFAFRFHCKLIISLKSWMPTSYSKQTAWPC